MACRCTGREAEVFENGNPVVEDAERRIRDLQVQVGEITMERDFLSSALGRERASLLEAQ